MGFLKLNRQCQSSESLQNSDLIWNLQGVKDKEFVMRFLQSFASRLCLMSTSVNQLYCDYSIENLDDPDRLTVLPAAHGYHDSFTIPSDAMISTHLFIVPGSMLAANSDSPYLAWLKGDGSYFDGLPLWQGLERLIHFGTVEHPFLPVITTSDVHYADQKMPIMHLNRLDANKLGHLSPDQLAEIQTTIESKICCSLMCA